MFAKNTKKILARNASIGQEIYSIYEPETGATHLITGYITKVADGYIEYSLRKKGGTREKCSSSAILEVDMDADEIYSKYKNEFEDIYKSIQNPLGLSEIGYHEYDNSWLYGNIIKMAGRLREMNVRVVGHCDSIVPKRALFSDCILDIAIVCETEMGKRFWCHFSKKEYESFVYRYSNMDGCHRLYMDLQKRIPESDIGEKKREITSPESIFEYIKKEGVRLVGHCGEIPEETDSDDIIHDGDVVRYIKIVFENENGDRTYADMSMYRYESFFKRLGDLSL
jgi:hypothetical protein